MGFEKLKEIVDNLNNKIWGENAENEHLFHLMFTCTYSTTWSSISFNNEIIWDDENEGRIWIEENNDYEDLELFVIKSLTKKINELEEIKTLLNG